MSAQAVAEAFGEAMHRALEKSRPAFEVWRHNLEEARDQVKEVRDRVAEWGLTESDLAVKKLQLIGATKSQVDEVRHLSAELERLDEINNIDKGDVIDTYLAKTKALTDEFNRQAGSKLQLADATKKLDEQYKHALETEAKSWRDKIGTPAQKLAENLKHLEAIRAAGDFRSDSEYRAAVQKARQEYEQEIGAGGDHTPRGVDSRSADAADLIARSLNRSAGADIAAQQLAQQVGMGQTLRQIAANTAKTSSGARTTRYGGL
jgi:adenine-specific DNA methylase